MNLTRPKGGFMLKGNPPPYSLDQHAAGWRRYMREKAQAWRRYREIDPLASRAFLHSAIVARDRARALVQAITTPPP